MQLAPGIETDRVPMDGRNWEYASEDPFLSGQTGAAEVKGIQSQHVIVTLKHYIANSQETDRMTDSADVDQRTLEEMYAPQYDVAIHQGGAMGVMCSYNRINSVYACENPQTLKGMLDGQFGFTGMVVSDWGATHSTVASALNGLDIEMNVTPGTYFGPALETAVQDGQVPMSDAERHGAADPARDVHRWRVRPPAGRPAGGVCRAGVHAGARRPGPDDL